MGEKPTSRTEKERFLQETLFGGSHSTTKISKDGKTYTGRGNTPKEAEEIAREKYEKGEADVSLCYLTTACTSAMGFPDSCLELTVLRRFRDNVLLPDPRGRVAVRDYYKVAPEIVAVVNAQADAQKIWQGVYRQIRHAVSLVLSGDFNGAFRHYEQTTRELKENFLR